MESAGDAPRLATTPARWSSALRSLAVLVLLARTPADAQAQCSDGATSTAGAPQGPPAIKQEELAHEPGSPARAACPSVDVELRRCYPSQH